MANNEKDYSLTGKTFGERLYTGGIIKKFFLETHHGERPIKDTSTHKIYQVLDFLKGRSGEGHKIWAPGNPVRQYLGDQVHYSGTMEDLFRHPEVILEQKSNTKQPTKHPFNEWGKDLLPFPN